MKLLALVLLVVLAGCAEPQPYNYLTAFGTTLGPRTAAELAPVLAPELSAGQQWTYRRLDVKTRQEVERFSQTLSADESGHWSVFLDVLSAQDPARVGSTVESYDPAHQVFTDARLSGTNESLRFPLAMGASWTFNYQLYRGPGLVVDVKQTATVRGWESLTVPAGRFRALRVEHEGHYSAHEGSSAMSGRIHETFWYAPAAQHAVVHEFQDSGLAVAWRDELTGQAVVAPTLEEIVPEPPSDMRE